MTPLPIAATHHSRHSSLHPSSTSSLHHSDRSSTRSLPPNPPTPYHALSHHPITTTLLPFSDRVGAIPQPSAAITTHHSHNSAITPAKGTNPTNPTPPRPQSITKTPHHLPQVSPLVSPHPFHLPPSNSPPTPRQPPPITNPHTHTASSGRVRETPSPHPA